MSTVVRERLQSALTAAMKSRDSSALGVLRSTLGTIANAEAVDVQHAPSSSGGVIAGAVVGAGASEAPRRELTDADVVAIVEAEIADRRAHADEYDGLGRDEDAARLRAEAAILSAVLSVDDSAAEAAEPASSATSEGVPEQ